MGHSYLKAFTLYINAWFLYFQKDRNAPAYKHLSIVCSGMANRLARITPAQILDNSMILLKKINPRKQFIHNNKHII